MDHGGDLDHLRISVFQKISALPEIYREAIVVEQEIQCIPLDLCVKTLGYGGNIFFTIDIPIFQERLDVFVEIFGKSTFILDDIGKGDYLTGLRGEIVAR